MIGHGAAGPSAWQSWMAVAVRGAGMACRLGAERSIQRGARDESESAGEASAIFWMVCVFAAEAVIERSWMHGRGVVPREANNMTAVEAIRMAATMVIVLCDFMGEGAGQLFQ